jgi:hypothetical protein
MNEPDVQLDGNSFPALAVPEAVYYSVGVMMALIVRLMHLRHSHCCQFVVAMATAMATEGLMNLMRSHCYRWMQAVVLMLMESLMKLKCCRHYRWI